MAIYTIQFTVDADGATTPREPQAAGVSGDHQAAVLRFTVPFSGYRYRLEIADGGGGYDVTDLLTVTDGCVTYPIPAAWTAAGLAAVRLVGVETDANGTVAVRFHSAPAYLFFEERSEGEMLGGSLQPAWQETLDAAQFFMEDLNRRLQAGEFKGEKGDKGDVGDVSLVDELELVIDGGDAGGTVEITCADRVIEEGTDGIWTYRKWESGVAECWGSHTVSFTPGDAWGSLYVEREGSAARTVTVALPHDLFTHVVSHSVSVCNTGYLAVVCSVLCDATELGFVPMSLLPSANPISPAVHYTVLGRWKE